MGKLKVLASKPRLRSRNSTSTSSATSTPRRRSSAVVWRSVMISSPAKLRREHYSLAIEQEQTAFVPFEDIAVIVLNHREITLTHPVLSACAEYGIGLYATGSNHQPAGVFLPFLPTRATRMMRRQLNVAKPTTKQAWACVVRRKIENQAACLRLSGKKGSIGLNPMPGACAPAIRTTWKRRPPPSTSPSSMERISIAPRSAGPIPRWITAMPCCAEPLRAGWWPTACIRQSACSTTANRTPSISPTT
jgi:hypothetical protein